VNADTVRLRRYLLGQSSDDEAAVVERDYLRHEEALEAMITAEDDLIEEFLADRLSHEDRRRFETHYLASPEHRARVEVVRRLSAAPTPGAVSPAASRSRWKAWMPLAAAALLAIAVAVVILSTRGRHTRTDTESAATTNRPSQPSRTVVRAPPPAPHVFAVTVSPVTVRGADDAARIVVPPGSDVVAMNLERDLDAPALKPTRAVARTVAGADVWQGVASAPTDMPAGAVARIEVPVSRLGPDDYVVELFGAVADGSDRLLSRYFVRVRAR